MDLPASFDSKKGERQRDNPPTQHLSLISPFLCCCSHFVFLGNRLRNCATPGLGRLRVSLSHSFLLKPFCRSRVQSRFIGMVYLYPDDVNKLLAAPLAL